MKFIRKIIVFFIIIVIIVILILPAIFGGTSHGNEYQGKIANSYEQEDKQLKITQINI